MPAGTDQDTGGDPAAAPEKTMEQLLKLARFVRLMTDIDDMRRRRMDVAQPGGDDAPEITGRLSRAYDLIQQAGLEIPDSLDPISIAKDRSTDEARRLVAVVESNPRVFLEAEQARLQAMIAARQNHSRLAALQRDTEGTMSRIGTFCGHHLQLGHAEATPVRILLAWRTAQSLRSLIDDMMVAPVDGVWMHGHMAEAFREAGGLTRDRAKAAATAGRALADRIRHVVDLGMAYARWLDLDAMANIDPWLNRALQARRTQPQQPLALDFSGLNGMTLEAGRYLASRLFDHGPDRQDRAPIMVVGDQAWLRAWHEDMAPAHLHLTSTEELEALAALAADNAPAP